MMRRMQRELALSAEQEQRINELIDRSRICEPWGTIDPDVQEELKHLRQQIQQTRTAEQRTRFEHLCRRGRERRSQHLGEKEKVHSRFDPEMTNLPGPQPRQRDTTDAP